MALGSLYPADLREFILILVAGIALDLVYPFHRGVMYRIHPVHTAYSMALSLSKRVPRSKLGGAVLWSTVVFTHMAVYAFVLYVANAVSRVLWLCASVYIFKVSASLRLLLDHVYRTGICLRNRNLDCARNAIAGAVRRDVFSLGEGHVASAAIETLFENLVDGFTAPLLYYALLGPLGALLQRLVNTLDAAVGYRTSEFAEIGWFSAKADSAINYLPARITALFVLALCPVVKGTSRRGLEVYLSEGSVIESVNARVTISCAAGCLGIRLEKVGFYSVGREYGLSLIHI